MFEAGAIKICERVHHVAKGITSFAFSDIRRLIANAVLSEDFMGLWPHSHKSPGYIFADLLLCMVA